MQDNELVGNYKNLKIVNDYEKLVKLTAMNVDLLKGTINGIPLKSAMDNWINIFPMYTKANSNKGEPFYEYYGELDNYLRYSINKKIFGFSRLTNGLPGIILMICL